MIAFVHSENFLGLVECCLTLLMVLRKLFFKFKKLFEGKRKLKLDLLFQTFIFPFQVLISNGFFNCSKVLFCIFRLN